MNRRIAVETADRLPGIGLKDEDCQGTDVLRRRAVPKGAVGVRLGTSGASPGGFDSPQAKPLQGCGRREGQVPESQSGGVSSRFLIFSIKVVRLRSSSLAA